MLCHCINGVVQDRSNSSVIAMELLQSCTKPLIWYCNDRPLNDSYSWFVLTNFITSSIESLIMEIYIKTLPYFIGQYWSDFNDGRHVDQKARACHCYQVTTSQIYARHPEEHSFQSGNRFGNIVGTVHVDERLLAWMQLLYRIGKMVSVNRTIHTRQNVINP